MAKNYKYERLNDKDWLNAKYNEGLSTTDIAKIVGCAKPSVIVALKRLGIKARSNAEAQTLHNAQQGPTTKFPKLYDKEWLQAQARLQLHPAKAIASQLGCTLTLVSQAFKREGIKLDNDGKFSTKYPQLLNKNWLCEQYTEKQYATTDIARSVGCSKAAVRRALITHLIKLRSNRESRIASLLHNPSKSRKYKKTNDKGWLAHEYQVNKRGLDDLAQEIGCKTSNTIRQGLSRAEIPIRGISEALTLNRTDVLCLDMELIEGCLLGDGFMTKYNKETNTSAPSFNKRNIHKEHLEWVVYQLLGPKGIPRITPEIHKLKGKEFSAFFFSSKVFPELLETYNNWYPAWNNRVKVVPRTLKLTPQMLLNWFLDDGTSGFSDGLRKRKPRVTFCTDNFSKEDNEYLVAQLANLKIAARCRPYRKTKQGSIQYRIAINMPSVKHFFDVIGPPPVKALAYKWIEVQPKQHRVRRKYHQLSDKEWLQKELEVKTRNQIARELGCSFRNVNAACKLHQVSY